MTFRWLKLWSFRNGADFGDFCQAPRGNGEPVRGARGFRVVAARRARKADKRAAGREIVADLERPAG